MIVCIIADKFELSCLRSYSEIVKPQSQLTVREDILRNWRPMMVVHCQLI